MAEVTAERAPQKIFVSGTWGDLGSYQLTVRYALLSLGWEPVWEAASQEVGARKRLREKIAECEAFVYLVGECYGPEALQSISDPLRSFAQLEFDLAWELNKPICIFLFADSFPFDRHEDEPIDCRALQKAHRSTLCSDDKRCVHITREAEFEQCLKDLLPRADGSPSETQTEIAEEEMELLDERLRRLRAANDAATRKPDSLHAQIPAPGTPAAFYENVQFTAYQPRVIAPNKWTKMLVFTHLDDRPDWLDDNELGPIEEMEQEAARILGSRIDDYRHTTSDSSVAIPQDGEITLVPEINGIEFNPPRRAFLWKDGVTVHYESFDMRANVSLNDRIARGRLTIFLGHVILAEITLSISVGHATERASTIRKSSSARAFRRVFTSYSHRDVQIVEATERYGRTLGDEYIRDLTYLRSGELWNDQLQQLVRWADVFQLFWSLNAARSKYVEDEWRYALSLNRPKFLRPTYWQEPMPEPPEPLRELHFYRLNTEMQPGPPPSTPEKDQEAASSVALKPKPLPTQWNSISKAKFMPSSSPRNADEPRKASYAPQTGLTLRGKLIVLGLVVVALLLSIVFIWRQ